MRKNKKSKIKNRKTIKLSTEISSHGKAFSFGRKSIYLLFLGILVAGAITVGITTQNAQALVFGSVGQITQWIKETTTIRLRTETDNVRIGSGNGALFVDTALTRVGIGTAVPGYTLDVAGTGKFSGALTLSSGQPAVGGSGTSNTISKFTASGTIGNSNITDDGVTITASKHINLAGNTLFGNSTSGGTMTLGSTSHATKGKILFGTSAYNEVNNRLGIGNASPTQPLDVTGNTRITGHMAIGGLGEISASKVIDLNESLAVPFGLSSAISYRVEGTGTNISNLTGMFFAPILKTSGMFSAMTGILMDLYWSNSGAFPGTSSAYAARIGASTSNAPNMNVFWSNPTGLSITTALGTVQGFLSEAVKSVTQYGFHATNLGGATGGASATAIGMLIDDQSGASYNMGIVSLGDVGMAVSKKFYLEASASTAGTTYLWANGAGKPELYATNVKVWDATTTQFTSDVDFGIADAKNIVLGTTTGTKIGTATSQKIGFWNATPVVQPSGTGETVGFTAGSGTGVNDASTFTGNIGSTAYRINDIVKALKQAGILAQ